MTWLKLKNSIIEMEYVKQLNCLDGTKKMEY